MLKYLHQQKRKLKFLFLAEVKTKGCQGGKKNQTFVNVSKTNLVISVFLPQMCETKLCKSKMWKLEKILGKKKKVATICLLIQKKKSRLHVSVQKSLVIKSSVWYDLILLLICFMLYVQRNASWRQSSAMASVFDQDDVHQNLILQREACEKNTEGDWCGLWWVILLLDLLINH